MPPNRALCLRPALALCRLAANGAPHGATVTDDCAQSSHGATRALFAADDLVQDCLCRALRKSHLFQPDSDLRAWLFTILHNLHVNGVRSSIRQGFSVPIEDVQSLFTEPPAQGAGLTLRDLDRAMGVISEEQGQVLLLVGLESMSYEEVAAILDLPVGTIRSRMSRGRERLRELIGHGERKLRGESVCRAAPASAENSL